MKNNSNSFASIFAIINKVNESHSDTPVKRETEKFEKKISGKTFRPKHTRILMRNKTQDEYDKVSKEVKYKSFIGLDEYGKSNSAVGKYGISKDASITRFNKKKTAKNLFSYIPSCGYEIEIESPQYVTGTGDLKGFQSVLMEETPQPMGNFYDNIPDEYIENRLNGDIKSSFTPTIDNLADYQDNIISHQLNRDDEEKDFRNHIMDLIHKYHNGTMDEDEATELVNTAFDIGMLERIESTFYGKKYQYIMINLKDIYMTPDYFIKRTNALDDKYGVNDNIIPIVRNQCPNLKPYQQKFISSLIRELTTYSAHEEIRDKYLNVFAYMMSTCVQDKKDEVTIEEIFDNFTMIVAPKYQAIIMAEISILPNDLIGDIDTVTLGEITTLLRNYIEVLPTKVEALFLYLDKKYDMLYDVDYSNLVTDVLDLLPVQDWLKQQYPAIYAMLVDIGRRATQYASLFKDSKLG